MCNLTLTFKRSQQQCCNKQQLPLVPHVHYQHQIGSMCPYVMGGTPVTRTHTHTHTHTSKGESSGSSSSSRERV
jgi:hypothetical protein